jgi:hypothetical protein
MTGACRDETSVVGDQDKSNNDSETGLGLRSTPLLRLPVVRIFKRGGRAGQQLALFGGA